MLEGGAQVFNLAGVIAKTECRSGAISREQLQRPFVHLADGFDPLDGVPVRLARGIQQEQAVFQGRVADFRADGDPWLAN